MRLFPRFFWIATLLWLASFEVSAKSYPAVEPMRQSFDVPDVSNADVMVNIRSNDGATLYKLQCHAAGYTGDPDFDYSGDFECRLSSLGHKDTYSTLLTEDSNQSRDWESRGRFFAADLRGACARVPQFGAKRSFELRGMTLTLHITDPTFKDNGALQSLRLNVSVNQNKKAQRPIAKIVPLPKIDVPLECRLSTYFVDPKSFSRHL